MKQIQNRGYDNKNKGKQRQGVMRKLLTPGNDNGQINSTRRTRGNDQIQTKHTSLNGRHDTFNDKKLGNTL